MRDYVIFTDCTADLPEAMLKSLGVQCIPMDLRLGISEYTHYADGRELGIGEFYERLKNGERPSTARISEQRFMQSFAPVLEAGKDILYIAFSSALSGSYAAACEAAETLLGRCPGSNICVVDSLSASAGEGLLVCLAAREKAAGRTLTEVADYTRRMRSRICHWFSVDDLYYLKKGGRISPVRAALGTLLNIKPVLRVDGEGCLVPADKAWGRRRAIEALAGHAAHAEGRVFIAHGGCGADAQLLARLVREKAPLAQVDVVGIGPVVGAHSGPGTLALFYMEKQS